MMVLITIFILLAAPVEPPAAVGHRPMINPVDHFIEIMRTMMLKGAGLVDIVPRVVALLFMETVILTSAVFRYRKTTA